MNQRDFNAWIEKLISDSRLDLEDLCGKTQSVTVGIVGKGSCEDRFIGESDSQQFLKIDITFEINETNVTRTVYNGMLPTCNYIGTYSQEQIFEFEMAIQFYFNNVGKSLSHYWNIPVVEKDLELYELMSLDEVMLPVRNGLPCPYEKADTLQLYRKEEQPSWASKASALGAYIAKHGMAVYRFKDRESESTVFVPLQKVINYSTQLLDGFKRSAIVK